jgi:hypothetical protein
VPKDSTRATPGGTTKPWFQVRLWFIDNAVEPEDIPFFTIHEAIAFAYNAAYQHDVTKAIVTDMNMCYYAQFNMLWKVLADAEKPWNRPATES